MRPSKINVRTVIYICIGLVMTLACVLVVVIIVAVVAVIVRGKNVEQHIQLTYDSIIHYPNSDSVFERTDFGSSNSIICGMVYLESWRGTNAPFSEVKKYYDDEFAGRKWKQGRTNDGISPAVIADASVVVEILDDLNHSYDPPAGKDLSHYQTVYLLRLSSLFDNSCS